MAWHEAQTSADSTPRERPHPVETSFSKKFSSHSEALGNLISSSSDAGFGVPSETAGKGFRLLSLETLSKVLCEIGRCSECGFPLTLVEDLASRKGLASTLKISCTNTACRREGKTLDPNSPDGKSLNVRSVMGMRSIGEGRAGLESFCGVMDMLPPLGTNSYSQCATSL